MPKHKKGESKKDWMKRCVPYVVKKEGLSQKQARGKCNGMYDTWKKKQHSELQEVNNMSDEYEKGENYEFRFDSVFGDGKSTEFNYAEFIEKATSPNGYNMVIAKGNMFLKGIYISTKEMKAAHKGFNNTLHDLNHMASGYANGFSIVPPDISYIVGWQDGLSYDDTTDEVRANVHIEKTAFRYDEWKSYIDVSSKAGRTPNVSMFVFGKIEYIEARKLPKGCGYGRAGYNADDLVPCMASIQPFMVSTVTRGACDDKNGCGIKQSYDSVDKPSNEDKIENEAIDQTEVDRSIELNNKRLEYYKKRLNVLKGDK